jgi:hypothetical protein
MRTLAPVCHALRTAARVAAVAGPGIGG